MPWQFRQGIPSTSIALAMDKARLEKEWAPAGTAAGGRLFIAEVGKGRITVEETCHFQPLPAGLDGHSRF